jgi:hypothetical protein
MSLTPNPPLNPKITRFYVPANTRSGGAPSVLLTSVRTGYLGSQSPLRNEEKVRWPHLAAGC